MSCRIRFTQSGPSLELEGSHLEHHALESLHEELAYKQAFTLMRHVMTTSAYAIWVRDRTPQCRLGTKKMNVDAPSAKDWLLVNLLTGARCDGETSSSRPRATPIPA